MMNLSRLWIVVVFLVYAFAVKADSISTRLGDLSIKRGKATIGALILNDAPVFSHLSDVVLSVENLWVTLSLVPKEENLFLFSVSGVEKETKRMAYGFVVLNVGGEVPEISNMANLPKQYVWDDNHYVKKTLGGVVFGLYVVDPFHPWLNSGTSDRMQFVYQSGKLEEYKGPWRGPKKPETYLQPTGDDPCWNVNGVEDCREEIEREKAAKRAKQRRKASQPAATK